MRNGRVPIRARIRHRGVELGRKFLIFMSFYLLCSSLLPPENPAGSSALAFFSSGSPMLLYSVVVGARLFTSSELGDTLHIHFVLGTSFHQVILGNIFREGQQGAQKNDLGAQNIFALVMQVTFLASLLLPPSAIFYHFLRILTSDCC